MIDVTWLDGVEREELRRSLVLYKAKLNRQLQNRESLVAQADARWRLHVVETMLNEINAT